MHGDCTMRNCSVVANLGGDASAQTADGIFFSGGGILDMANCWVSENGVPNAEAGGAIWINYGSAILQNCIVSTNARAGICGNGLPWTVVNCTVAGNFALGINFGYGSLGITNSIVYFNNSNGEQIHSDVTNAVTFAYSDVQGGVMPGVGNLSLNPSLCPSNQSLLADSPCIDGGSPDPAFNDLCMDSTACSPLARGGVRNDMGAYGGPRACAWGAGNMPAIITQPQSQASCPSGTVSFAVGATGRAAPGLPVVLPKRPDP